MILILLSSFDLARSFASFAHRAEVHAKPLTFCHLVLLAGRLAAVRTLVSWQPWFIFSSFYFAVVAIHSFIHFSSFYFAVVAIAGICISWDGYYSNILRSVG